MHRFDLKGLRVVGEICEKLSLLFGDKIRSAIFKPYSLVGENRIGLILPILLFKRFETEEFNRQVALLAGLTLQGTT